MAYINAQDVNHIRVALKKEFPQYKFSVTRDHHLGVNINFMKGPRFAEFESFDTTDTITTINGLKAGRTFVYLHETGSNDDGAAMANHIESGDIDIADGDNFMSISRFIPDFKNQVGNVDVTMKTRPYPTASQKSHGPFEVETSTTKKDTRIRGRQIAVRLSSGDVDDKWRYGTLRLDMKPDGMRGA